MLGSEREPRRRIKINCSPAEAGRYRWMWFAAGQEVEIEERSFVAKSAPLDDGQLRAGGGWGSAAEPEALAEMG
ncbi:MAG TPA: hypothetical protein VGD60_10695 [Candidatus Acidoferrales bacterium]